MALPQDEFNPHNRDTQIALLALRVENLGREKEEIERHLEIEKAERIRVEKDLNDRVSTLEASYGKGAGILIGLGMIGGIGGVLIAYGKSIFAPWLGK